MRLLFPVVVFFAVTRPKVAELIFMSIVAVAKSS
jgi:hypothetical protein